MNSNINQITLNSLLIKNNFTKSIFVIVVLIKLRIKPSLKTLPGGFKSGDFENRKDESKSEVTRKHKKMRVLVVLTTLKYFSFKSSLPYSFSCF
jgi:hypothetical protein